MASAPPESASPGLLNAGFSHSPGTRNDAVRPDGPSRARGLRRIRLATGASAGMCIVALLVAAAGLLPFQPVLWVSGYCLAGNLCLVWLQSSGRSARFRDPACVFASHLFSISILLLGCGLIPEDRNAALQLFLLIWAFDLPRMSRRQQTIAASFAVLGLSIILLASWWASGLQADLELRRNVLALATTALYLPGLIAIGHTVRRIHAGQKSQRTALAEALVQLRGLSERDVLTGASNRRHGEGVLAQEAARQLRSGRPFSICLLDLDHFKRINDIHGHTTGDAVLVGTACLLREALPEPCTIARWGGEEFLVVMPEIAMAEAVQSMERARSGLSSRTWPDCAASLKVDFSAGVCEHRDGDSIATTLERADRALYRAKAQGRGQVVDGRGDS